tara:strand:+ start:61 stop:663 length:603 start_codon:yes stop_codon:yes gene_type:complete
MKFLPIITTFLISFTSIVAEGSDVNNKSKFRINSINFGRLGYEIRNYYYQDSGIISYYRQGCQTGYMSLGLSISRKTNIEFIISYNEIIAPYKDSYYNANLKFIPKASGGLAVATTLSDKFDIRFGGLVLFSPTQRILEVENNPSDDDFNLRIFPKLFWGIQYRIPISKNIQIPVGLNWYLPSIEEPSFNFTYPSISITW